MRCTPGVLPACLALLLVSLGPPHAGDTPLRIGIPETFYHDMSPALIREVTDPFADVLRETSGLKGEAVTGGKPLAVARQLHENKLQLAVLHGFEFAWAQQQYADLLPLMVADRTSKDYRACIMVRKDAAPADFAALKGKDIAIPKRTAAGCRLFLDRLCTQNGAKRPDEYFAHILRPTDVETGLDDLARGKYPAVLVDTNGLEFYKDLKPGVFGRFKVLMQSGPFPPLVIAYHKGALPEATLNRIRDGLRASGKTENGRAMMKTWHISAFTAVPADFAQAMATSLKRYPPPK